MAATYVGGLGMVTPVGGDAPRSCAALRAGVAAFQEIPGVVDAIGEPVIGARISERAALDWSEQELAETVRQACEECLIDIPRGHRSQLRGTLTALCGDDGGSGFQVGRMEFWRALSGELGFSSGLQINVLPQGNAAGVAALLQASARLTTTPEATELIVGVDSLARPKALVALERAGRLKGSRQPRGVIPGEACAAILLASTEVRRHQPICRIVGAATAPERATLHHEEPCLAEGLTQAVHAAMGEAKWASQDVAKVYCDMNGEAYRAHEWALTLCRTLDSPDVMHPADCIGDVGAAFTPLLIGMAATALRRGYARTDKILVFCSSERGLRGCACVAAA